ncbi:MAG: hypothetical protein ABII23_05865 [bacterium]
MISAIIRFIIVVLLFLGFLIGVVNAEEKSLLDEMKIIKGEGKEEIKKDTDAEKVIEKYYYKKEVIKEVPEEKGKYEKHLFDELRKRLKKPKKIAEVWRVEDDLIELNKGAIHKVREGDVYGIYGKNGKYKGKMEVGAIADAVSIGESLKKKHYIEEGDIAKYIGQRRFWGMGLLYGVNILNKDDLRDKDDNYEAFGVYWRLLFKKAWGIGITLAKTFQDSDGKLSFGMGNNKGIPNEWNELLDYKYTSSTERYIHWNISLKEEYNFLGPVDIRKYFFHPAWYTGYIGIGSAYFESDTKVIAQRIYQDNVNNRWINQIFDRIEVFDDTKGFVPAITTGIELTLSQYLRFVVSGYYLYGPKINIYGYKPLTRPLILSIALVGSW